MTAIADGDKLAGRIPDYDPNDPASLEAWFGSFGYADPLRKCVLANCKEIIRAKYTYDQPLHLLTPIWRWL